jgi:hypothetical protein
MGFGVLIRIAHDFNPKTPSVIILTQDVTSIGRRADVRMDTLTGHEISKVHACISRRCEGRKEIWMIEDQESVNGTFVNSKKVHSRVLTSGNEIIFAGGPNFKLGDMLECSSYSSCRYRFVIADPVVRFASSLDPNASMNCTEERPICPICYDGLVAPEELPCGHSFCLHCIHDWDDACRRNGRRAVCPMCRAAFLSSQLTPREVILTHDGLEVWSLEAMLRDLRASSCRVIRRCSIFKKWDDVRKKWFWSTFGEVKGKWHYRVIFLHLTKATTHYILQATDSQVLHAMENFGIESVTLDADLNRRRLLFTVLSELRTRKSKTVCVSS